jgi:hypothetical protein
MSASLAGAWRAFDGLGPEPDGHLRCEIRASSDHEIACALWPRGVEGMLQGYGASRAWLHVLCGTIEEERYLPLSGGEWSYEHHVHGAGASFELPQHALHRLSARRTAQLLVALSPRPTVRVVPFDGVDVEALRRARLRRARDESRAGRGPSWEP